MNLLGKTKEITHIGLKKNGFDLLTGFAREIYSPDTGEVLRYFSPDFIPRSRGISILGKIGIIFPAFEKEWREVHGNELNFIPFGMLIDNCERLTAVPIFRDDVGVFDWLDLIVQEVLALPRDVGEVAESLGGGRIGSYPLNFFYLPNEKSESARSWFARRKELGA